MTNEELETELGRAYRALRGIYGQIAKGKMPDKRILNYHSMTIGAAIRFVDDGALDGSQWFIGKHVTTLGNVLRRA